MGKELPITCDLVKKLLILIKTVKYFYYKRKLILNIEENLKVSHQNNE